VVATLIQVVSRCYVRSVAVPCHRPWERVTGSFAGDFDGLCGWLDAVKEWA